ncbi:MAG TPA: cobalamin-independent methionine synthase II family protein [Chloroflexota bacterium]|nr:cobalamin-independent methionine synthase II family protein [Chloroflexota bacterium]HZU07397.1 cobalamin-independent methionine synthase II family protein [Chloroflexota bacterium]
MKRSTERILTTHCGSLPRPKDLLDLMRARARGEPYDATAYATRVREAVRDVVRQQVACGIDVVTDGEQGKLGFFAYVSERLTGFEPRPGERPTLFAAEVAAFPEYYEQYFRQAMLGGALVPMVPLVCTGPVRYQGQEALQRDIDNLKAALAALDGAQPEEVFMPAVAPSGVGSNAYYRTEEEYLFAVAEAMRTEYRAIVDAGFVVQIDDPFLTELFSYAPLSPAEQRKKAELYVAAINHALEGIPPERVRFHTCYGINEGPRVHDAPLRAIVDVMLQVNAGAYSFEAANPRHEHEYHLWEDVKLPEGKILIPGVITHASNIVEHPELIAERIVRYAERVGRENVIAGADCGFSSQATYQPEVHPTVVWAKFRALAEGARLATQQLWR